MPWRIILTPATAVGSMGRMLSSGADPGYAVFAMSEKGEIQPPGGELRRFPNRQEAEAERKRLEQELGISYPKR